MTCCSHAASEHRGGRCDGWVTVDGEQVRCGCAGGVWVGRDDLAHSFDCIVEGCERCLALRSLAALGVVDDTTEPAEPEVGAIMRRLLEDGHLKLLTPTPGSSEHAAPLLLADGGVTTLDFAEADLLRELLASPLAAAPTPPPTTNVGAASSSVVDAPVPPTKTTCNQCGHDKSDHYLRMAAWYCDVRGCEAHDCTFGAGSLGQQHQVTVNADTDFARLVNHHRECEHIADRMADALRGFTDGERGAERAALVAEWDAHQWPDLRAALRDAEQAGR